MECAVSPPYFEHLTKCPKLECAVSPPLILKHLVSSVVSLAQLVSSSVALPAELVSTFMDFKLRYFFFMNSDLTYLLVCQTFRSFNSSGDDLNIVWVASFTITIIVMLGWAWVLTKSHYTYSFSNKAIASAQFFRLVFISVCQRNRLGIHTLHRYFAMIWSVVFVSLYDMGVT